MSVIHIEQLGNEWRTAILDVSCKHARYVGLFEDFEVELLDEYRIQTLAGKTRYKRAVNILKGDFVQFLWSIENDDTCDGQPQWLDAVVTGDAVLQPFKDVYIYETPVIYTRTPVTEDMQVQSTIQFIDDHTAYDPVYEEIVPWRFQGSTYEPDDDFLSVFTPTEFEDFLNTTVSKVFTDNLLKYTGAFNRLSIEVQNNIGQNVIKGRDAVVERLRNLAHIDEDGDIVLKDSEIRKAFQETN